MNNAPGSRTIQQANELYQINRWSEGYFGVDADGHLAVRVDPSRDSTIPLTEFVAAARRQGVEPPLLLRFPQVAQHRLSELYAAFARASEDHQYTGRYRCVYPIKANPQRAHVEDLLDARVPVPIGLEAGSKSELLAVIAMSKAGTPIVCNGYKDRDYVEMAIRAVQLGRQTTIILEKPSEARLVIDAVHRHGVSPIIGLRTKLAARGSGHWEATGGTRSKFGLSASELLNTSELIRAADLAEQVQVLHFHLGSQINDIRVLKKAVIEAARIYADLALHGFAMRVIDVGGGLGVDYSGHRRATLSSVNYLLQEYANDVVCHIQAVCDEFGIAHPDIYSESGRAVSAHHCVLTVPVSREASCEPAIELPFDSATIAPPPLVDLQETLNALSERSLLESYHDAEQAMETVAYLFRHGHLTLRQRGDAELLFRRICRIICERVDGLAFVPPELAELEDLLADNEVANFSIFRSLPDHWALGQLFPIVPLAGLDRPASRRVVLSDITCDSDGRLDRFVSASDTSSCLHVCDSPEGTYLMGVFLVGAYQEIMGDCHNLFGRLHEVSVAVCDSSFSVEVRGGETIADMLARADLELPRWREAIEENVRSACLAGRIDEQHGQELLQFFAAATASYTYLATEPLEGEKHDILPAPHRKPTFAGESGPVG